MTPTAHPGAPSSDVAQTRLAQIAKTAQSDRAKAIRLAIKAKADGLRSPLLHYLVAQDLRSAEKFEDAIAELGLGLELAPNEAGLMSDVGFCLMELDRRGEAARVFEAAIRADPTWAPASYGYGWAAERVGALDQARSAWERTLKLDPRHADALAGLAGLAGRRSDWAVARDLAKRALEADQSQSDALTTLVRADLGQGDPGAAIAGLERITPLLTGGRHADARLLLGDALDAAGRYDEAFAAYAEGKAELREIYAPSFAGRAERPSATQVAHDIAAEFERTPVESWTLPLRSFSGSPVRGHAFLLGFPRSGTTLLEQIIATHPDMVALGERPALVEAVAEFLSGPGGVERLAATVGDLLEPYRDSYWARARQFAPDLDGKVLVDKYPLATIRLPLMSKVFPEAKIIFALRDPRDVVLSSFRRAFKMNASMYEFTSLESSARFYDAVMAAGETYTARLPLKVHRLRYEDLVTDFEREGRALCDFLGVEWTPTLQNFAATDRTLATPSGPQVARGLYSEGVGQWRNYARQLEPVAAILAPWIEKFGYSA
ncbi:MAG TPA: sulfotransferase [Caulobacteraceae bacterium]|jgi:tetratricopeptide (TPR) repeat protein